LLDEYRRLFPDKLLLVTEFGNASTGVEPDEKARQYLDFHAAACRIPNVGAAFAYVLSSSAGDSGLAWRREGDPGSTLVRRIGERSRT
jgi:hypothetical protein